MKFGASSIQTLGATQGGPPLRLASGVGVAMTIDTDLTLEEFQDAVRAARAAASDPDPDPDPAP